MNHDLDCAIFLGGRCICAVAPEGSSIGHAGVDNVDRMAGDSKRIPAERKCVELTIQDLWVDDRLGWYE